MNTGLIEALKGICRVANADPEITKLIIKAARGEGKNNALITTKGAALILECHAKSVFRYAERGLLKPIRRSPRCIRWRKSDVLDLANKGVG